MKTDPIKNYIQQNREAFDTAMPGAEGWKRLEKTLVRYEQGDGVERTLITNRLLLDTHEVPVSVWAAIVSKLEEGCPDPLEHFIAENREAFDSEATPGTAWDEIIRALPETPRPAMHVIKGHHTGWKQRLLRAAAAVALLATALAAGIWYGRSTAANAMAMSQVSPEYAELEQYYQRHINGQKAQLVSLGGSQPAVVLADLEQLDRLMAELQKELADVPPGNREQVVRAMIDNYKAKTAILERVLQRLEQTQFDTTYRKPYHDVQTL